MRLLALLLALVVGGCAEAHAPNPRDYALRLEFRMADKGTVCGATAVAEDAIETAVHCMALPLSTINGTPAKVVSSHWISPDRVRVVVSGIKFKVWARFGNPVTGERLRWYGHPMGIPFVYREGRVAMVYPGGLAVDATICHGDSGSGLFNDAGELVGVVSAMTNEHGCTFMVAQ